MFFPTLSLGICYVLILRFPEETCNKKISRKVFLLLHLIIVLSRLAHLHRHLVMPVMQTMRLKLQVDIFLETLIWDIKLELCVRSQGCRIWDIKLELCVRSQGCRIWDIKFELCVRSQGCRIILFYLKIDYF